MTLTDDYHGPDLIETDGWGHNATYDELGNLITDGKGWKELGFRSPTDEFMGSAKFMTYHPDGRVVDNTDERQTQHATWDEMIKERDGEESGASVEMRVCRKGVRTRVDEQYELESEEQAHDAGQDSEGAEKVDKGRIEYVEVKVTRARDADYVQDGKTESKWDNKLLAIFSQINWKEIGENDMFIYGAENDPCSHL